MFAVAATMLLSIGAAADASVQHFNLNSPEQCYSKGSFTVCYTSTGEANFVQAPSGNFNGETNGTSAFVASYNGAVVATGASAIHEHVLATDNFTVIKEAGIHETSTFTYGGTSCTMSADIHVTDLNPYTGTGHYQYNNFSFICV
jgi:hypothetical protein